LISMIFFIFCMDDASLLGEKGWHIKQAGLFMPLQRHEVQIRANGELYVRSFSDRRIQRYDARGKKIGQFGAKGKGPGEFTFPVRSFFLDDRMWVLDMLDGSLSEFNEGGDFVRKLRLDSRNETILKVSGGWVFGNWGIHRYQNPAKLLLVDNSFENVKLVRAISEPGNRRTWRIWRTKMGDAGSYSPINTQPQLFAAADGSRVFLTDAHLFKIYVYDNKGGLVHTIERNEKRIPFDREWAEADLKGIKAELKVNVTRWEKLYPEYFPAIREIIIDPNGNLAIDRWRGRPDDNHYPITLNMKGEEVKAAYSWETLTRLLGTHGNYGYLSSWDATAEEAGFAKVLLENLNEFVKKYPVVYEGSLRYDMSLRE